MSDLEELNTNVFEVKEPRKWMGVVASRLATASIFNKEYGQIIGHICSNFEFN